MLPLEDLSRIYMKIRKIKMMAVTLLTITGNIFAVNFWTDYDHDITVHIINKSQDVIQYDFHNFIQAFNLKANIRGDASASLEPNMATVLSIAFNEPANKDDSPYFTPINYRQYANSFIIDNTEDLFSPSINGISIPIRLFKSRNNTQMINFVENNTWIIKQDTDDINTATNGNALNIGIDGGGVNNPSTRDIYFYIYPR